MKEFFGLIPFVKIPEASIHHFKEGCDAENVNLMELHFPFC